MPGTERIKPGTSWPLTETDTEVSLLSHAPVPRHCHWEKCRHITYRQNTGGKGPRPQNLKFNSKKRIRLTHHPLRVGPFSLLKWSESPEIFLHPPVRCAKPMATPGPLHLLYPLLNGCSWVFTQLPCRLVPSQLELPWRPAMAILLKAQTLLPHPCPPFLTLGDNRTLSAAFRLFHSQ